MTNKFVAIIMLSMSLVACGGSGGANASTSAASTTQKPKVQIDFGAPLLSLVVGSYPSKDCNDDDVEPMTHGAGVVSINPDFTVKTSGVVEISGAMHTLNAAISFEKKLDRTTGLMDAGFSYGGSGPGYFSVGVGRNIRVVLADVKKISNCSYSGDVAGLTTKSVYQTVAKFLDMPKTTLRCETGLLFYQLKEGIVTLGDKTVFNLNADLTEESTSVNSLDIYGDGSLNYTATASDGRHYYHRLDKYGNVIMAMGTSPDNLTHLFSCHSNI